MIMAMKISTKGRYALRVLIDLAEHDTGEFVPLKLIAERQEISEKYLESIAVVYSKAGLLAGHRGKGGGYRLAKAADAITVREALELVEGDLAPVACLAEPVNTCDRQASCRTLPMWQKFYDMTLAYFSGITIADLTAKEDDGDFYSI